MRDAVELERDLARRAARDEPHRRARAVDLDRRIRGTLSAHNALRGAVAQAKLSALRRRRGASRRGAATANADRPNVPRRATPQPPPRRRTKRPAAATAPRTTPRSGGSSVAMARDEAGIDVAGGEIARGAAAAAGNRDWWRRRRCASRPAPRRGGAAPSRDPRPRRRAWPAAHRNGGRPHRLRAARSRCGQRRPLAGRRKRAKRAGGGKEIARGVFGIEPRFDRVATAGDLRPASAAEARPRRRGAAIRRGRGR